MGRVIVENVVVDDPATAAFLDAPVEAGENPVRVVSDAIEVGARVLAREQNAIGTEFVRNEFEKVSREVETAFTDKARVVAEFFGTKVDEVFGPENGHLAKELAKLFGEGSSAAVQHQLRQVMLEQSARMREDLLRQFSSADGSNPLADFKAAHLRAARDAATRQEAQLEAMREQMVALKLELAGLRSEREKAVGRRRRGRARHGQGPPVRGGGGRGGGRDRARDGRRLRRGRRLPRRRRAQGRRRGGHRRLLGRRARADRLRGQERAQVAPGGAGRARGGDGPARRRLRRLGRAVRGPAARAGAGAARGRRRQAVRGLRPRGGSRWRCRSPTRSPGRGC